MVEFFWSVIILFKENGEVIGNSQIMVRQVQIGDEIEEQHVQMNGVRQRPQNHLVHQAGTKMERIDQDDDPNAFDDGKIHFIPSVKVETAKKIC